MQDVLSFRNRDDLQLSYFLRKGEIPALLIPGFGCNHSSLMMMTEFFTEKYELVIPDNRGMGLFKNVTSDYTINDLADDCLDLMDNLGHEKFHVVGTSMGGFVAQILMTKHCERVLSTSLLCTTSNHPEFIPIKIYSEEELRAFDSFPVEEGMKLSTERIVHHDLIENHHDQFIKIVDSRIKNKADIDQLLWQRNAVASFFKDKEQKIDFSLSHGPYMFMSGDGDSFVDPQNVKIFKDSISGGETLLIDHTDHLFFMEKPSVVVSSLENFWENSK